MIAVVEQEILKKAKNTFPSWIAILDGAFNDLNNELTKDYVSKNFCRSILAVEKKAYDKFSEYEAKAFPELVVMWYENHSADIDKQHQREIMESLNGKKLLNDALKAVVRNVIHQSYPTVREFQVSIGQMRKKRAGETFQEIVLRLLKKIDIPCEKAKGSIEAELGHTDIVVPSVYTAIEMPDKAYFMACQRTLAERWWSSTSISKGGRRGYILTIDKHISKPKAMRLKEHNLVAYVRDDVKAHDDLKTMAWIRKLSDLPSDLKLTSGR